MKLITLLSLSAFVFLSYSGNGQSLTANGATTPLNSSDENMLLEGLVTIHNSSANSLALLVERTANNLATGHTSNFCWGIACYSDATDTAPASDAVTLGAGADTNCFHGWLNPHGNFGSSSVTYRFFDMNNTTDGVTVTFTYDFATGIHVLGTSLSNPLSEASPNPANSMTGINYSVSGNNTRLIVYNLLGNAVKEIKLGEKQGALILTTSDLSQGIYYYSLLENGKTLATRKLVVSHK
jgi:hypothetical protein